MDRVEIMTRPFRMNHSEDPRRVIRGKIDTPRGAPRSSSGRPHVILVHGFKGFMDWGFFPDMARRLVEQGIAVVRFNVSGSGVGDDLENFGDLESFAHNTLSKEIEDIATVHGWIRNGGVADLDPHRGAWIGHSRGGGLALVHAAEEGGCRGLVAWSAVSTFDRFDDESKSRWRRDGFLSIQNARTGQEMRVNETALLDLVANRARFDVPSACGRLAIPVLLVHGDADETVPVQESERLLEALQPGCGSLLRIPDGGHTFGIRHPMTTSSAAWEATARATLARVVELLA